MVNNNQNYPSEAHAWLVKELAEIRQLVLELKESTTITTEWIPRSKVMEFFAYGDTQMGSLEKSGELVVSKVGNRKFFHRASLLQLLQANIQGDVAPSFFLHSLKPLILSSMRKHENCKYCGKPLKGRSDKECCNNKCKSQYHNKKNRDPELPENITKKALHKNYKALKHFLGYERRFRSGLPLSLLISEGFDRQVYTEITMHPESGWNIRWVYDLGLAFNLETNRYQLHRRDGRKNLLF